MLTIVVLVSTALAIGLIVRGTPALSLRIPTGWSAAPAVAHDPGVPSGGLDLIGPDGARFTIIWGTQEISNGCAGACGPTNLQPVNATLDGTTATLYPLPITLPGGNGSLVDYSYVLGPFEHDFSGRAVYFTVFCQPSATSASGARACADIVTSIGWSAPLFAHWRSGWVVVPIS